MSRAYLSPARFGSRGRRYRTAAEVLVVMDFWIGVESEAAAVSAAQVTCAGKKEFRQAMGEYSGAADGDVVQADFAFHRRRQSDRQWFVHRCGQVPCATDDYAAPNTTGRCFSRTDTGHLEREHEGVAEAIPAEDPESALAVMRLYSGNTRRRLTTEDA